MHVFAGALAQVDREATGVHLLWSGPACWPYAPGGWVIERRPFPGYGGEVVCERLEEVELAELWQLRERMLRFGTMLLRTGVQATSILDASDPVTTKAAVFTTSFDTLQPWVEVIADAQSAFVFGLRDGKVVDTVAGVAFGSTRVQLEAAGMDAVVVHAVGLTRLLLCVREVAEGVDAGWGQHEIKRLQLPFAALMPALGSPEQELAQARSRLLDGEALTNEDFESMAASGRLLTGTADPPRAIDQVLLLRARESEGFEEVAGIAPIAALQVHPKWRRVLGLGWFDDDPALQVGQRYQYRVTGHFPKADLEDRVYGFHTVPSQTTLPAEFSVSDLRVRLGEPARVALAPGTATTGLRQVSRRGIEIHGGHDPHWLFPVLPADWDLVLDFPQPVHSVVLELEVGHRLAFAAGSPWSAFPAVNPVPAGIRVHLSPGAAFTQLRLRGRGFLYAVRVPASSPGADASGNAPASVVLEPVLLASQPPPPPPLRFTVTNLQHRRPAPSGNTSVEASPARHDLGHELRWLPPLYRGLQVWPADQAVAPPLVANLFEIESRQVALVDDFPADLLAPLQAFVERSRDRAPGTPAPSLPPELLAGLDDAVLDRRRRQAVGKALVDGNAAALWHLLIGRTGRWQPLLEDENWMTGTRVERSAEAQLRKGQDLLEVFPERPRPPSSANLELCWRDVFDFPQGGAPVRRPTPPPGTLHQYRMRTVDAVGRAGRRWMLSHIVRLEKHQPPPMPAGPEDVDVATIVEPQPMGVQARVLVRDAPDLTSAEKTLLGNDDNLILLSWGWPQRLRDRDPLAREFRVYFHPHSMTSLHGTLTRVRDVSSGVYRVDVAFDREVVANALTGRFLHAGYPFVIASHTSGENVEVVVDTKVPTPKGAMRSPAVGAVTVSRPMSPELAHAPAWQARVAVVPIAAQHSYQYVFRNQLQLEDSRPDDTVWVGVSTADDQPYVQDPLHARLHRPDIEPGTQVSLAPSLPRPGNESPIAAVPCAGNYHGRPQFDVPPPLQPVPEIRSPEPAGGAVSFDVDLLPHLAGAGLASGDRVRPERVSAEAVLDAYEVTAAGKILARVVDRRDASEQPAAITVAVPGSGENPADRAAVLAALDSGIPHQLEDRFLVFLAAVHPHRDRMFTPASDMPVPWGPFTDTLPPKPLRYVYRLRKSDAADHLSAGTAVAPVVVRVPSPIAGPTPVRIDVAGLGDGALRLGVVADPLVTHVLAFSTRTQPNAGPPAPAEVLRVANRGDLFATGGGVLLRSPEGELLEPVAKSLSAATVTTGAGGQRELSFDFALEAGESVRVWAVSLTRDGVPSLVGGTWRLARAPAPPVAPMLSGSRSETRALFSWRWPAGAQRHLVAIERELSPGHWQRVSPPLPDGVDSHAMPVPAAASNYRLGVRGADGRVSHSNVVRT